MDIVSRERWGAPLTAAATIHLPSPEIWLHHTGSIGLHGAAGMRSLRANALNDKLEHYVDIPYSFVVDGATVYEARGAGRNSGATMWHNDKSHAICVMGNFEIEQPSKIIEGTIAELIRWGHAHGWWPTQLTGGHRDTGFATACPGRWLHARIPAINALAKEVAVQFVPPIGPFESWCNFTHPKLGDRCTAAVKTDGGVYCLPDNAYLGRVDPHEGGFAGRKVARIEARTPSLDGTAEGYVIIATSGERYRFP